LGLKIVTITSLPLRTIERDLEFIKKFKAKSTLTEADALRLGKEVSKSLSNRLRRLRQ